MILSLVGTNVAYILVPPPPLCPQVPFFCLWSFWVCGFFHCLGDVSGLK